MTAHRPERVDLGPPYGVVSLCDGREDGVCDELSLPRDEPASEEER
jgi:hypothetical protein